MEFNKQKYFPLWQRNSEFECRGLVYPWYGVTKPTNTILGVVLSMFSDKVHFPYHEVLHPLVHSMISHC